MHNHYHYLLDMILLIINKHMYLTQFLFLIIIR